MILSYLIHLFAAYVSSLEMCLFRSTEHASIGLFVFLFFNFKSWIYILVTSHSSSICFVTIFFQSMTFLLILLTGSIPEQKFLIWPMYQLFLSWIILLVYPKKSSPDPRTWRLSPVLSSRIFTLLCFTSRFMIDFELILWNVFFIWISNCPRTICWKHYPFPF